MRRGKSYEMKIIYETRHMSPLHLPFIVSTDALILRDLLEHEVTNATGNQVPSSL